MTTRLLLIEDSASFRKMIAEFLRRQGYEVFEAWSLATARTLLPAVRPAIILLDLELEEEDGSSLLLDRTFASASTIVISMRESEADRVNCLQSGAEDYIVKPVDLREMLLRIRRIEKLKLSRASSSFIDFGAFLIDFAASRVVYPNGGHAALSRSEYGLLRLLVDAGDGVVTRADVSQGVFGSPPVENSRAIDVLVSKLRRKLDPSGCASPIWSVRGEGYRFTARRRENVRTQAKTSIREVFNKEEFIE